MNDEVPDIPQCEALIARVERLEAKLAEAERERDEARALASNREHEITALSANWETQRLATREAAQEAAVARAEAAMWKRECQAAADHHRYALDATFSCLPDGTPDTEPNRWVAIAHRFAELEAEVASLTAACCKLEDEGLTKAVAAIAMMTPDGRCGMCGSKG